jgi:Ca2+-binding EF-hand superfamily protein
VDEEGDRALARVFDLIDSDGSGKISTSELQSLFESLGAEAVSPETINKLLAMDDDGEISREEFVRLMSSTSMKVAH